MHDPDFEQAWREYAAADAQVKAPRQLRDDVMAAWDAVHDGQGRPARRWRPLAAAAAIAAAGAIATAAALLIERSRSAVPPARASVPQEQPAAVTGPRLPMVMLTSDAEFAGEPLHVVHVRLPRTAFEAIGLAQVEPDQSGLVELDVVVGSDGLPRAIRALRPVAAGDDVQ